MEEFYERKAKRDEALRKKFYNRHYHFGEDEELIAFQEEVDNRNTRLERKKKLKERVRDIGMDSALHGLNIIIRYGGLKRIYWILIFFTALGTALYFSIAGLLLYLQYETTSEIRYVNELPGMFPTVTVCNRNPFTTDFSIEFIKSIMTNNSLIENGTEAFDPVNLTADKLDTILYLARAYAKSDYFSDDEKRKLGFSAEGFLLGCQFNFYDCDMRDWTWYYDFYYGNCYIFNSGVV